MLEYFDREWGTDGSFDDEQFEEFLERLGVDEQLLWFVRGGRVVQHRNFEEFVGVRRASREARLANVEAVEDVAEGGPEGLEFFVNTEGLLRLLPPLVSDERIELSGWDVPPKAQQHRRLARPR